MRCFCPQCGTALQVATQHVGRRGRCPTCQHVFRLGPEFAAPPATPFPAATARPSPTIDSPSTTNGPTTSFPGATSSTPSRLAPSNSNNADARAAQASRSQASPSPASAVGGATTAAAAAPPRPTSMRLRRLNGDAEHVQRAFADSPLIHVQTMQGRPPELYRIEYHVGGLTRGPDGRPQPRDQHVVEIQLTHDYPRQSPKCRMLTPVFHPNIDPTVICVGDHWTASERLVDLIVRIGELIAFQAYNVQSPLDGEAAMWTDLHRDRLPIDRRDLRPPEA